MTVKQNTFDAKAVLSNLPIRPGVYRMYDKDGKVLYVGKARNLKKRVSSYYRVAVSNKTAALVERISDIDTTITGNEVEALLLEQNLIKQLKPPFNILFKDDKSYPYIYVSTQYDFPALRFYRGARPKQGKLLGPWPSSSVVRDSLIATQKLFQIRGCEESVFRHRSTPCLQYQIKRCSAPCVGLVSQADYAKDLRHANMFLEGKSQEILVEFKNAMVKASDELNFEAAAKYRDTISNLRRIQEKQDITVQNGDVDVIVAVSSENKTCILVLFIRSGRMIGQKSWFPKDHLQNSPADILVNFLSQFYLNKALAEYGIPKEAILNISLPKLNTLQKAITVSLGRKIVFSTRVRSRRKRWQDLAVANAQQALSNRYGKHQSLYNKFVSLQNTLGLPFLPQQIECFDVSHISGTLTVASCVVFGHDGPTKGGYRRFNIADIKPGDDYAAIYQAVSRHYRHLKANNRGFPEILFIDGGKGQANSAQAALNDLNIPGILVMGVAKGAARKPGMEKLVYANTDLVLRLKKNSSALHLIQNIRDEAHRFAITGHRKRRRKLIRYSELENIPGIGQKRRQQLIQHFGGIDAVKKAEVRELTGTPGISHTLAITLYEKLHFG